jgi:hypothetical protein
MDKLTFPRIEGNIEIVAEGDRIVIAGDPVGLKSLANSLLFLAGVNQEEVPNMPIGERYHTHLYPGYQISENSSETEICRLDAKGTNEFPAGYKAGSFA